MLPWAHAHIPCPRNSFIGDYFKLLRPGGVRAGATGPSYLNSSC